MKQNPQKMQTITKRQCHQCGEIKPLEEFCRDRNRLLGRKYECRQCTAAYRRAPKGRIVNKRGRQKYQQSEKGRITKSLYDKKYRQTEKGKLSISQAQKTYGQTLKGRITRNRANKNHYQRAPAKKVARSYVRWALKQGMLTKPTCCSGCGKEKVYLFAHHDNYDKPLKIIWLCRTCHTQVHIKKKAIA